jgi:ribosome-binding ATPase YchF (GTP1/OBG family)
VIERISNQKSSKQAPTGWHTLRRSLATLLNSNGENVKVAQSQLHHTSPTLTLGLYHCENLFALGSEQAVKEKGLYHSEGKEYTVKDRDILFFKFNV